MYALFNAIRSEPVLVNLVGLADDSPRLHISYGPEVALSVDLSEAVDLIDAVTAALAEYDRKQVREIRRDDNVIRLAAEVRESL